MNAEGSPGSSTVSTGTASFCFLVETGIAPGGEGMPNDDQHLQPPKRSDEDSQQLPIGLLMTACEGESWVRGETGGVNGFVFDIAWHTSSKGCFHKRSQKGEVCDRGEVQ